MKKFKNILLPLGLIAYIMIACEPRIGLDEGQWGDHAYITSVIPFKLEEEEHQLQEYYENGVLTPGIRRIYVNATCSIDNTGFNVAVKVPSGTDLTNIGLIIMHEGKRIEPLNGAPIPGYLSDFSNRNYTYRVISADGTKRDWTISFTY